MVQDAPSQFERFILEETCNSMIEAFVRLYGFVGTGLIVEHKTGVVYSNQAGGYSCLQPAFEGAFIPIRNGLSADDKTLLSPETDLEAYFTGPKHKGIGATSGLDADDADFIDGVLTEAKVDSWLRVDRGRLAESCEAWVFVEVLGDEVTVGPLSHFQGLGPYPKRGVLTWTNSD